MQKINKFIADNGLWIFLGAAAYKLTFYIINLVSAFTPSSYDLHVNVGAGIRTLFSGLLGATWDLIILAVILEVSKKIASGYPAAPQAPRQAPASPYTAPMPAQQPVQQPVQQAAAQPTQPAQPAQPVQPAQPTAAIWTCPNCGSQNNEGMAFCAKCGNKR